MSHSNVGCWAVMINSEGQLQFSARGKTPIFMAQYTMPLNTEVFFAVTFDGALVTFYVDGSQTNQQPAEYDFNCNGDGIDVGWYKTGAT